MDREDEDPVPSELSQEAPLNKEAANVAPANPEPELISLAPELASLAPELAPWHEESVAAALSPYISSDGTPE